MFLLFLVFTAFGQIEQIMSNSLGSTLLETIQLHMKSNEPIENLVDLMNGIQDSLEKQIRNNNYNYTIDHEQCIESVALQKIMLSELHDNKMSLKEEIQLVKPRIAQIDTIQKIKQREIDLLEEQVEMASNRLEVQKQTYEQNVKSLNEQRYDYVSFKVPFPVKTDTTQLKPIMSKLVDFVNELLQFEDYGIDAKTNAYTLQIQQIGEIKENICALLQDLSEEKEELKRKLFGLEIDLEEVENKVHFKKDQLSDMIIECQDLQTNFYATIKQLHEQQEIVRLTADLIEYNYGWLRQQLGL